MLLKQPLARCAPAVLPTIRPVGDRQPFGACRDLAFDDAEMALRLGLRGFHAREAASVLRLDHRSVLTDHRGKAGTSGVEPPRRKTAASGS